MVRRALRLIMTVVSSAIVYSTHMSHVAGSKVPWEANVMGQSTRPPNWRASGGAGCT
jgi:hypothetical protein